MLVTLENSVSEDGVEASFLVVVQNEIFVWLRCFRILKCSYFRLRISLVMEKYPHIDRILIEKISSSPFSKINEI